MITATLLALVTDLNYVLSYTNNSNGGASNVLLTDTVPLHTTFVGPAGWSCASGAPAGTKCTWLIPRVDAHTTGSVLFTVKVNAPLASRRHATDQYGAIGDSTNPNAATAKDTTPVIAAPKLLISKSDGGSQRRTWQGARVYAGLHEHRQPRRNQCRDQ